MNTEIYNKKILLVEDELELQELILEELEINGFKGIQFVNNGREALEIIKNEKVDLVLADLFLPGMNGIDLYHEMQNISEKPEFILITGADFEQIHLQVPEEMGLIKKPFDFEILTDRVIDILSRNIGIAASRKKTHNESGVWAIGVNA